LSAKGVIALSMSGSIGSGRQDRCAGRHKIAQYPRSTVSATGVLRKPAATAGRRGGHGAWLDAFVYAEAAFTVIDPDLLRFLPARILFDERGFAKTLIERMQRSRARSSRTRRWKSCVRWFNAFARRRDGRESGARRASFEPLGGRP
jgi:hypothetical protein